MPVSSLANEGKAVTTSADAKGTYITSSNVRYNGLEWRATHPPDYHVYVFNVSSRTFSDVGRIRLTVPGVTDSDIAEVGAGKADAEGLPEKILKPGERFRSEDLIGKPTEYTVNENEKWHYCTSFPQPILIPKFDDQSNNIAMVEQDAIRFVVDQINPDNPTKSLDIKIPEHQRFSIGGDFSQKGIFFSLTNPPNALDVRRAVDRMETYYMALLEKAQTLELTDRKSLEQELGVNPDYGYAADYYGKEVSWRKKPTRTAECPNCGAQKPANRKFHMADFGLCVEPTVDAWKSVVQAGIRTRDAVPHELKWWTDEKHVPTGK